MSHSTPSPATSPPPARHRRPLRWLGWIYRLTRNLLALGMLLQVVFLLSPLPEKLYRWLVVSGPPVKADYIVCLGGGGGIREIRATQMYRGKFAPKIIVSNEPAAAYGMRELIASYDVPRRDILVDTHSLNTAAHPHGVARLHGIDPAAQRFLLVTDDTHSRRALAVFRKAGYRHVSVYAGPPPEAEKKSFYDRMKWRVSILSQLIYEYAGLLSYWWQGLI